MKLTLADSRFLKDTLAIISELVNEITFKISSNMIHVIAIDPANVAMVDFKLLSSAFSEYQITKEQSITVNLESLKQIVRRAKPTDMVTLELDEEKNRLVIKILGETTRKFDLALLEPPEGEQKVPNLEFPVKIESNALFFNEAIEDMGVIGDSLSLAVNDQKSIVACDGNLSSGKVVITSDQDTTINSPSDEEIKAKYSIEYLKKLMKGSKLSNTVYLNFGQDYPLRLEYKIIDRLHLAFVLAPRVAND